MSDSYVNEDGKFDTQNLIMDSFLANLGDKTKQKIVNAPITNTPITSAAKISTQPNFNTEKLLTDLWDTRDDLVTTFNEIGFTRSSQTLVDCINKLGTSIKSLGGEVDVFDPLANMSGLTTPKLTKNAERVLENTKEAYSLNKIEDTKINEDGKTIIIAFAGKKDNMNWKAVGEITANDTWMGNEALDYIYTTNSGRMSVKVPTSKGWIDKSSDYKIKWELFENEDIQKEAGIVENKVELKEEVIKDTSKDIDADISDVSDNFEIKEE